MTFINNCDAASGRPGSAATFGADLADEAAVRALVPRRQVNAIMDETMPKKAP